MIKNDNKKWIIFFIGFVLSTLIVLMFFGWQYAINRPNYRDLQNAYKDLKLPADWQKVSETSNKGTLGLFCWQIGGEECPYMHIELDRTVDIAMAEISTYARRILAENGYSIYKDASYIDKKCSLSDISQSNYSCSERGYKNNLSVYIELSSENSFGKKGQWLFVGIKKQ